MQEMSGLQVEWEMLRMALASWMSEGRSLVPLSERTGVARATMVDWVQRSDAPETIRLGSAVMEAIKDESVRVSGREQADTSGADGRD